MGRLLPALLITAFLLAPRPATSASFATPLKIDSIELVNAGVLDDAVVGGDVYCGNASSPGDGFLYIEDTDVNVDLVTDYCPGEERFRMLNTAGPFQGLTGPVGGQVRVTLSDVAPAPGEAVGVSFIAFADAIFTPLEFVRFEVRNVGGQLYYGVVDELGETGFTNTLDFDETLVLELTSFFTVAPEFRYATDGGAFVDVTAELSAADALSMDVFGGVYLSLEAAILPEPAPAALLLATLVAMALRRRSS